ncbi:hypothetical protein RIR_jg42167.t1 [Rhizophagus irregularis DAOM 181602=DAOM 197198]|nr:hypothetical protein RIR_jg42167.t1 [Rhizophagus irregularis DAOM 181602=DAOM 197198]
MVLHWRKIIKVAVRVLYNTSVHIFCKRSFRHSHDLMTRTNTNMNGTLYNTRGDYLAWCNKCEFDHVYIKTICVDKVILLRIIQLDGRDE